MKTTIIVVGIILIGVIIATGLRYLIDKCYEDPSWCSVVALLYLITGLVIGGALMWVAYQ